MLLAPRPPSASRLELRRFISFTDHAFVDRSCTEGSQSELAKVLNAFQIRKMLASGEVGLFADQSCRVPCGVHVSSHSSER